MAAMNISTAARGASAAKRSWRVGERLRHQLRHQRTGAATPAMGAGLCVPCSEGEDCMRPV